MKLNDILTTVLGVAVVGMGSMVIFVYSTAASDAEKIMKNTQAIEEIKKLIAEKTADRFTKDDGLLLGERQWEIMQRVAALESKD